MLRLFYLNVNGFYGTRKKDGDKLKNEQDDNYCLKNAEDICEKLTDGKSPEYHVIFLSEFAPNTPSGKRASDYLKEKGYNFILPNACDDVENRYYSIVAAYVKQDFKIERSEASPKDWLTWHELSIEDKTIIGIHSTRAEFLKDMKDNISGRGSDKKKNLVVLGDTNVTENSEKKQKELMNELIENVGAEVIDRERKNTFIGDTKPDRVFSNVKVVEFSVIDEFIKNDLSDHDGLSVNIE